MSELFGSRRAFRLAKGFVKPTTRRLGLHVRRYETGVQGLDPLRDMSALLTGAVQPVIIDVGANQGQSTMSFARTWPRAEIHSFEPSPNTFKLLETNVNDLATIVHLVNAGVGARKARRVLFESSHSDMSSFLEPTAEAWGSTNAKTPVDVLTLDDYCSTAGVRCIDLLKSDTQGYDLEVLRGADRLIGAGAVRLIFIEVIFAQLYEHAPSFEAIYQHLTERDFAFIGLYEPHFTRNGHMAWCDALFAHSKQ